MRLAEELQLDLVEISAKADPPVCKIMDYQKFLYQQKKKAKEMKANAAKVVIKEIRFGPNTDEHDFQFKLKHAQEFLSEGAKEKAYVFFRDVRSFFPTRVKSCCSVLPSSLKITDEPSRCRNSKGSA